MLKITIFKTCPVGINAIVARKIAALIISPVVVQYFLIQKSRCGTIWKIIKCRGITGGLSYNALGKRPAEQLFAGLNMLVIVDQIISFD